MSLNTDDRSEEEMSGEKGAAYGADGEEEAVILADVLVRKKEDQKLLPRRPDLCDSGEKWETSCL